MGSSSQYFQEREALEGEQGTVRNYHLRQLGAITGTINSAVDYSGGSATVYALTPPSGEIWKVQQFNLVIQDAGANFAYDGYGGLAALTLGIFIAKTTVAAGAVQDTLAGENQDLKYRINTNADLLKFGDIQIHQAGSNGFIMKCCIDFRAMGNPLELEGGIDSISVDLNDDFSTLEAQYFTINAYSLPAKVSGTP